ncbi:hypothetical protein OQX61_09085 [Pedobacter sp. PLR]|uniref:hypothetical protein n=1 Tax=Pedobacter sp. PLR TaxID=2994465 RepID=UPI002246FCFD|nr:hypothetical protein [Pedobacter sp. PLR]MCX2451424.1 hypothetical protein [Pedobacter sp. PLR]
MRKLTMVLSLLVIFASCKKESAELDTEVKPEPKPEIEDASAWGRVSFMVDGKLFTNYNEADKSISYSKGTGNSGANLKETTKDKKWTVMSNGKYWAGHPDSLQYSKYFETSMGQSGASIKVSFIKKYAKREMDSGISIYYAKSDFDLYKNTSPKFALDFERENDQEGVAIEISLPNSVTLTSYSPIILGKKSSLTAESHSNSTFKILKAERIKGTKTIELELSFEGDLFDKNEKPVKVTRCSAKFQLREGDMW